MNSGAARQRHKKCLTSFRVTWKLLSKNMDEQEREGMSRRAVPTALHSQDNRATYGKHASMSLLKASLK